jgi:protein phosphatase 1 regulatory subunit 7
LDISSNQLTRIENLAHLPCLEELWASSNQFDNECYDQVESELSKIKSLHTLYLEGNPMQLKNRPTYRNKVRLAIPFIKQIDAV